MSTHYVRLLCTDFLTQYAQHSQEAGAISITSILHMGELRGRWYYS